MTNEQRNAALHVKTAITRLEQAVKEAQKEGISVLIKVESRISAEGNTPLEFENRFDYRVYTDTTHYHSESVPI